MADSNTEKNEVKNGEGVREQKEETEAEKRWRERQENRSPVDGKESEESDKPELVDGRADSIDEQTLQAAVKLEISRINQSKASLYHDLMTRIDKAKKSNDFTWNEILGVVDSIKALLHEDFRNTLKKQMAQNQAVLQKLGKLQ